MVIGGTSAFGKLNFSVLEVATHIYLTYNQHWHNREASAVQTRPIMSMCPLS